MRKLIIRISNWIARQLQAHPTYITIKKVDYPNNYLETKKCVITGGVRG